MAARTWELAGGWDDHAGGRATHEAEGRDDGDAGSAEEVAWPLTMAPGCWWKVRSGTPCT